MFVPGSKAFHPNSPACGSGTATPSTLYYEWRREASASQVSGGVKACVYLPNFPIAQLLSGWEVQRQSCWTALTALQRPSASSFQQSGAKPYVSQMKEGKKKIPKNWENNLNHGQYITPSEWSNSLIETELRQGSPRSPSFLMSWTLTTWPGLR